MIHKLSIVSYNCQCANDPKLKFLRELYDKCDLDSKYSLDCKQIVSKWLMMEPMNVVIKVNQIKEMIQMRDRRGDSFLNAKECGDIINFLCLE